ncbi:MAG: hypothetical protein CR967_01435 [Proteobacteria bacterium]|nr:MAG: hypothetical protein CR967_01435 [Pseudomonadota bacterium]
MENKEGLSDGDKDLLLEEYDKEQQKDKNLEFKTLVFIFSFIIVILIVVLPNIYIKNQIYYISRDIGDLHEEYIILKEENREIRRKIEAIKFKTQVLDELMIDDE